MNILRIRGPVRAALCRSFATGQQTPFVPPASLEDVTPSSKLPSLLAPESSAFFTARSSYYEHMESLEKAVQHSRSQLKSLHLLPLPEFALKSLPQPNPMWKTRDGLSDTLSTNLSATRHRKLLETLNELSHFRRIAHAASQAQLEQRIQGVLDMFEREDKEAQLSRANRKKKVAIDEFGRSYTVGRRKTSSARVWMISSEHLQKAQGTTIPTTEIVVNNQPLNRYFPAPADRERILRPFRITGLLGAYNVFAIVRGGGLSGQSGAVANGVAKGLSAQESEVAKVLTRGMCHPAHIDSIPLIFLQQILYGVILVWSNAKRRDGPRPEKAYVVSPISPQRLH